MPVVTENEKPKKKTVGYALRREMVERVAVAAARAGVRPCVVVERALAAWLPSNEVPARSSQL